VSFVETWPLVLRVVVLVIAVFLVNLPFGAWRVRTRKRSLSWILSIHVPIPLLFLLRRTLGLSAWFIAFSVIAAVAGQFLGGRFFPPESIGDSHAAR